MVPCTIEFDIFDAASQSATVEKDVMLHCLPRIGDHVHQPGLGASEVCRVTFSIDGPIVVQLQAIKVFSVDDCERDLPESGFRIVE